MDYFRFSRNDKDGFVLTENDFYFFCEQYIFQISEKLGAEPFKLPELVNGLDFMQLDEVDELFQNYFTYKFLAREYNLEIPDRMHEIENFITGVLKLAFTYK